MKWELVWYWGLEYLGLILPWKACCMTSVTYSQCKSASKGCCEDKKENAASMFLQPCFVLLVTIELPLLTLQGSKRRGVLFSLNSFPFYHQCSRFVHESRDHSTFCVNPTSWYQHTSATGVDYLHHEWSPGVSSVGKSAANFAQNCLDVSLPSSSVL